MSERRERRERVTVVEALEALGPGGRYATVFEHGMVEVGIYRLEDFDPQVPHTRDELYFVILGSGMFRNGENRHPFRSGDMLFVPAGQTHRFEEFTEDLTVWVVFFG